MAIVLHVQRVEGRWDLDQDPQQFIVNYIGVDDAEASAMLTVSTPNGEDFADNLADALTAQNIEFATP